MKPKKQIIRLLAAFSAALCCVIPLSAETVTHTVVKGDTMWRTAVRYQVGLSEIIAANPQIKDPHWIYPGDVLTIPLTEKTTLNYEEEVLRLVNVERQKAGLTALKGNW
ncbi:MAG: SafA/ExsA family spore coat assembly protein, partial [Clostridia bacterium]|nr:SafA/ExsA family spore coat assembly protein [Clostridia bacterium]